MKFRFPGWGIGWFTPIFALIGPLCGYEAFVGRGQLYLFLTFFWTAIGLLALLTWFSQRWVAFPLIGFFVIAFLGVSMSIVDKGLSVSAVGKLVFSVNAIYELWAWRRSNAHAPKEIDEFGDSQSSASRTAPEDLISDNGTDRVS
jgi:hypothetical protein